MGKQKAGIQYDQLDSQPLRSSEGGAIGEETAQKDRGGGKVVMVQIGPQDRRVSPPPHQTQRYGESKAQR